MNALHYGRAGASEQHTNQPAVVQIAATYVTSEAQMRRAKRYSFGDTAFGHAHFTACMKLEQFTVERVLLIIVKS